MATQEDEENKQPWQISEKLDESQIVEEIRGGVIEQYFYEFVQEGKTKVGLSWAGVKFVARRLAEQGHPVSIEEIQVRYDDATAYSAMARAKDMSTGEVRFGAAEQPRQIRRDVWKNGLRTGESVLEPNPFAYALVISKAQRNAIRQFIPETAIQEGYLAWKQKKAAPAAARPASPPVPSF